MDMMIVDSLYHLNRENGKEFKAMVCTKEPYQNSASGDA